MPLKQNEKGGKIKNKKLYNATEGISIIKRGDRLCLKR